MGICPYSLHYPYLPCITLYCPELPCFCVTIHTATVIYQIPGSKHQIPDPPKRAADEAANSKCEIQNSKTTKETKKTRETKQTRKTGLKHALMKISVPTPKISCEENQRKQIDEEN